MAIIYIFLLYIIYQINAIWTPTNNYVVVGRLLIPYIKIEEIINVTYSGELGKEKIDYYNGLSRYYYTTDDNKFRYVGPVAYEEKCFESGLEEDALVPMFPDLNDFTVLPKTVNIRGIECTDYYLKLTRYETIHEYHFYLSVKSPTPVRLAMKGQNLIFGSHYDDYTFEYDQYIPKMYIPDDEFNITNKYKCGSFPGPGHMMSRKPLYTINKILPYLNTPNDENNNNNDNNNKYKELYNSYIKKYNKKYNIYEYRKRLNNFINNYNYINKINNDKTKTYKLGVNHMIDYDINEMLIHMGKSNNKNNNDNVIPGELYKGMSNSNRPTDIDWRTKGAVSVVKDQAHCGSCWTYGVAGTVEGTYFLQTGQLVNVSIQQIMDCTWDEGNNGCMGGEDYRAYSWFLRNPGLITEETYGPYLGQHDYCHHKTKKPFTTIATYYNVLRNNDALLDAIANKGPISVSVHVIQSFVFYKSGIYEDSECTGGETELNHIVLATGYGTENGIDYWTIKNSWSTYWGEEGYMRISRKGEACGITTAATFVKLKDI